MDRPCVLCGGSGKRPSWHNPMELIDCPRCGGSGSVEFEQFATADDEYCEVNGHTQGCPHDPTDWDARNKEGWLM